MWMALSITRPSIWWNIGVWVWSLSLRKVRPGTMTRIGGSWPAAIHGAAGFWLVRFMTRTCTGLV